MCEKYIYTYNSQGKPFSVNVLSYWSDSAPTMLNWLKNMFKDESLIIKVQKGHINIKTSISPIFYFFWKNSGCYHFNAKWFQTLILLLLRGQIQTFDIFFGYFLLILAKVEVE